MTSETQKTRVLLPFLVLFLSSCSSSSKSSSEDRTKVGSRTWTRDAKTDTWEARNIPASSSAATQQGLRPDEIMAVVREHKPAILACVDLQHADAGQITVDWVIALDGRVMTGTDGAGLPRLRIAESTLPDGPAHDCILKEVASWTFPRSLIGQVTLVTYPFRVSRP